MRTLWDKLTQEQQEKMESSPLMTVGHLKTLKETSFSNDLNIFVWYTLKFCLGFESLDETYEALIDQFNNFEEE